MAGRARPKPLERHFKHLCPLQRPPRAPRLYAECNSELYVRYVNVHMHHVCMYVCMYVCMHACMHTQRTGANEESHRPRSTRPGWHFFFFCFFSSVLAPCVRARTWASVRACRPRVAPDHRRPSSTTSASACLWGNSPTARAVVVGRVGVSPA